MHAYSICLWIVAVGQLAGPANSELPALPQVETPQPPTSPSFQEPRLPDAEPVAPNPAQPATLDQPLAQPVRSIYGQPDQPATPAELPVAPPAREAAEPPPSAAPSGTAQSVLSRALTWPKNFGLDGTPLPLKTVLDRGLGTTRQRDAVQTYWRLTSAVAEYGLAADEAALLNGLPVPQDARGLALLRAAQTGAKAQEAEARLAAVRSQHDLHEAAGLADATLPLPGDPPLIEAYRTYFDVLSARGAAPPSLRRIDQSLPLIRAAIDAHADAVVAGDEALAETLRGYEEGRLDVTAVLDTCESLRRQRRAFLNAVEEYNRQIAEYAFAVHVSGVTSDRLLGMLIKIPRGDHSVLAIKRRDGEEIRRVSNEAEIKDAASEPPRLP